MSAAKSPRTPSMDYCRRLRRRTPSGRAVAASSPRLVSAVAILLPPGEQLCISLQQHHCSPDSCHSHSPPPPRASFIDRMAEIDEALLSELLEEPCAEEAEDDDRLSYVIRSLEAEISNMNAVTTGDERGSSAGAEEASDDGGWEELLSAVDGDDTTTRVEEELFDCVDVGVEPDLAGVAVSDWFMDWDV
ncbi:unnamed protein product [Musa acuminata var. zebrina]